MTTNITLCINCNERPIIEDTIDDEYEFVLRHEIPCCAPFVLESYQHTEQQCIDDWNTFNKIK